MPGKQLTLFLYRNNLTIVEVVRLQGQGSWIDIRFSGRRSGSPKPLIFEMTDKQLKSCESLWCGGDVV